MKNFTKVCVIALLFIPGLCRSQSDKISENVFQDWGKSINGVRLSIGLTNSIVPIGSTFPAFLEMKNTSTNLVIFGDSSPEQDFTISLTGDTGKTYQITPTPSDFTRNITAGLHPGASRIWIINVSIDQYYPPLDIIPTNTDVPSGNYKIIAMRVFGIGSKFFDLASNSLKMQIK